MALKSKFALILGDILWIVVIAALIYTGFFCQFVYNGFGLIVLSAIGSIGIFLSSLSLYLSEKNRQKTVRRAAFLLFLLYCSILLIVLFGMRYSAGRVVSHPLNHITENINLIPFHEIGSWKLLVGNGLLFFPFGFLLPIIWRKEPHFKTLIMTLFVVIIVVELLQVLTGLGQFDVNDVILNMIGGVIGFFVWKIYNDLIVGRKQRSSLP